MSAEIRELTRDEANEISSRASNGKRIRPEEFLALEMFTTKEKQTSTRRLVDPAFNHPKQPINIVSAPDGSLVEEFKAQLALQPVGSQIRRTILKALDQYDYHGRLIRICNDVVEKNSKLYVFDWSSWFKWFSDAYDDDEYELIHYTSVGAIIERKLAIKILGRQLRERYPEWQLKDWRVNPRKYEQPADDDGELYGTSGTWSSPVTIKVWRDDTMTARDAKFMINAMVDVHEPPQRVQRYMTDEEISAQVAAFLSNG